MSTGPTTTIRGLQSDDWEAFLPLWRNQSALRNTVELPFIPEDSVRDRFNNLPHSVHTLIAEIGLPSGRRQPVGAAWLEVQAGRRRHVARLRLLLLPDYVDTNVEAALLDAALHHADQWLGLRRVETVIFADDARGRAIFARHGFEAEAKLRRYALRDGALADAELLARLRPAAEQDGQP